MMLLLYHFQLPQFSPSGWNIIKERPLGQGHNVKVTVFISRHTTSLVLHPVNYCRFKFCRYVQQLITSNNK